MTSAAIVMVSVFAIFASLHMVEMKELGLGLAVAVLVDALVIRVIVLPSLMTMLGRWNWWPGHVAAGRPPGARVGRYRLSALTVRERHRAIDRGAAIQQGHLSHAVVGELRASCSPSQVSASD